MFQASQAQLSGGLNCTCSLWYSPPLQMSLSCGRWERTPFFLYQRPHDKDICRGGEYHRLHVQFTPPDDGPVRPETCRGMRIADIVRRRKKQCIKLEIKNKLSLYLVDRASFSNSFYFFTNLIHLVFFTILAYLSLHVSDQSVHHQEDQMLNYTSSFWRRSLGRWSVVRGRWC